MDSARARPACPIRIGHVIGQLSRGGAERQLYELVRGIDRARFHCVVYCLSEDTAPFGDMIAAAGVAVKTLPRTRGLDVGRVLSLARLARRDRLDILHSFLVHASAYAWPARRLAGIPRLITSARNCQTAGGIRDRVIGQAFRGSDAIVCNGEAVREFVTQQYGAPAPRCRVIHNGVDLARFRPRPPVPSAGEGRPGPTIITVGRLVAQKDVPLLLEAAVVLSRDYPTARFVIVGDGPLREQLQGEATQRGLGSAVTFLGERADIPDLLCAADVFWLTSAWEGLPNVLLEAQASAVPVVTRDVGAAREIVRHGLTGYVVPGRDAAAFAARTRQLLADPDASRAMGLAGRQVVEETFSLTAMVRATEELYDTVLSRPGVSRGSR